MSATSVTNFCQLLSREDCSLGPCIAPKGVAWKFECMYCLRPSVEAGKELCLFHPALVPGLPSHLPASTSWGNLLVQGCAFWMPGKILQHSRCPYLLWEVGRLAEECVKFHLPFAPVPVPRWGARIGRCFVIWVCIVLFLAFAKPFRIATLTATLCPERLPPLQARKPYALGTRHSRPAKSELSTA